MVGSRAALNSAAMSCEASAGVARASHTSLRIYKLHNIFQSNPIEPACPHSNPREIEKNQLKIRGRKERRKKKKGYRVARVVVFSIVKVIFPVVKKRRRGRGGRRGVAVLAGWLVGAGRCRFFLLPRPHTRAYGGALSGARQFDEVERDG